jgi:hypothetical protein
MDLDTQFDPPCAPGVDVRVDREEVDAVDQLLAASRAEEPKEAGDASESVVLPLWRADGPRVLAGIAAAGFIAGFLLVWAGASPRAPRETREVVAGTSAVSPSTHEAAEPPFETAVSTPVAAAVPAPPSSTPAVGGPVTSIELDAPAAPSPKIAARPSVATTVASKPAGARAPSRAQSAAACNPPYRTDFFGKKVRKTGC